LSSWYPSRVSPTNGNFVQKHAEAIASQHKVSAVFAIGDETLNQKYEVTRQATKNVTSIIVYFKKHSNNFINALRKYKALNKGISLTGKFDIIHGNVLNPIGVFVWLISIIKRKPFIFTEHWSGYLPQSQSSLNLINLILNKFVCKKAKTIVTVSEELKKAMLNTGIKGNYKIIGNVVDTKLFYPQHNILKKFTILHVSNFQEDSKNIFGILKTIKELSQTRNDFIFKIVGDGDLGSLQKKIEQLNIPSNLIKVDGTKSTKQIAEILQQSNLYISFSNFETFGIVMTEAIACGVPVISTNTGILNELGHFDFIDIIKIRDEKSLLNKIVRKIESKTLNNSQQMFDLIDNLFSAESIAKQYSKLYYNIIKSED